MSSPSPNSPSSDVVDRPRLGLATLIVALAAGSVVYRVLVHHHLEQTAALFIGLPTLLALILTFTRGARTLIGLAVRGMTLALLMSGILLGEGFICIVMAAPLFYGVAILTALAVGALKKKTKNQYPPALYSLMILPLVPLSIEGVTEKLSLSREEVVKVERIVPVTSFSFERNLAMPPNFERPLPLYLRLGFPRPSSVRGSGLEPGDRRAVHFAGGEGKPGDLIFEVVDRAENRTTFRFLSDTSHVAHWLQWEEANVEWKELSPGTTRVIWTLRYLRRLDPAWYFGPWERYAVGLTAEYLIATYSHGP